MDRVMPKDMAATFVVIFSSVISPATEEAHAFERKVFNIFLGFRRLADLNPRYLLKLFAQAPSLHSSLSEGVE